MRGATLAAALALAPAAAAGAQEVRSVIAGADPFALQVGGRMWVYPTGRGDALAAWSSTDLTHWRRHRDLIRLSDIGWIKADGAPAHYLWAPDMIAANGRYYLYYAVGPQDPAPSRLGVATCTTLAGPCVDSGRALFTGGNGFEAIDPMVFVDPRTDRRYLYAGGSAGATLRVFELAADMVTIAREDRIDQPPAFTEGAFLHYRRGVYYLSYSSGRWNRADYAVHYATAPSPLGPWTYCGAILRSNALYKGPGHHSFVEDPRDRSWRIVYHRWEGRQGDGPYRGERRIAIQPIAYTRDGAIRPIRMSR